MKKTSITFDFFEPKELNPFDLGRRFENPVTLIDSDHRLQLFSLSTLLEYSRKQRKHLINLVTKHITISIK